MTTPVFHDKRGRLTAYALACGYIERAQIGTIRLELFARHGCYHVRAHCENHGRRFWESRRTLRLARKLFDAASKADYWTKKGVAA